MNGSICPDCDKDIGFMAVYKASLPSRIKCPHCGTRVHYKPFPWVTSIISIAVYIALLLISLDYLIEIGNSIGLNEFITIILAAIILWQPFEVMITMHLRKRASVFKRET